VFTTSAGAQEFFAPKANIQLVLGGAYEIFFDPSDVTKSTQGMKLLSYSPGEMLSFEWSGPPSLPEVRNGGMWVVVELRRERHHNSRRTFPSRLEKWTGLGRGLSSHAARLERSVGKTQAAVSERSDQLGQRNPSCRRASERRLHVERAQALIVSPLFSDFR
jgi:hypothetical protein